MDLAENDTMYKKDLDLLYTLRYSVSVATRRHGMKEFKFKVLEYSLVGSTFRHVIVKAKTLEAAHKKMLRMQGNRDWSWELATK